MLAFAQTKRPGGKLLKTAQQTIFHTGDDGDRQAGLTRPVYTVYSSGSPYSDTPNVDVPHYAGNDIAFVAGAPDTITSATVDFTTIFKAADTIICWGSPNANNLVVRTIATAGVAAHTITLTSSNALTNESVGNYITICKRVTPSGNVVYDELTKLYWMRYTTVSPTLKLGVNSDGKLNWYNATTCYVVHAAGADLAMDAAAKTLTIVGGTAESIKFKVGYYYEFAGFTHPNNNRAGGYIVTSVTPGAADLVLGINTGTGVDGSQTGTTHNGTKIIDGLSDTSKLRIGMFVSGTNVGAANRIVTIDSLTQVTTNVNSTGNGTQTITFTTLGTETAGGSRSIKVECQSAFDYCAACNVAALGGYTDWRLINVPEAVSIMAYGVSGGNARPDAAAFPSWYSGGYFYTSTTTPNTTNHAQQASYVNGFIDYDNVKTALYAVALVRS